MAKTWRRKYPRTARFPGTCTICDEGIAVGVEIAWAPGRMIDHWKCYLLGHQARRGPNEYRPKDNVIGVPERPGLSERARRDLEILRNASSTP